MLTGERFHKYGKSFGNIVKCNHGQVFRKESPLTFSSGVLCQSPLLTYNQLSGQVYDEVTRLYELKQNLIRVVMKRKRAMLNLYLGAFPGQKTMHRRVM